MDSTDEREGLIFVDDGPPAARPPRHPRPRGLRRLLVALGVLVGVFVLVVGGGTWYLTDRYAGNIDRIADVFSGLDEDARPAPAQLPGFQRVKPRVFAGLFPVDSSSYEALREALRKLRLNDASLSFEPETSQALGFGFRCGFLGMLHMEIVQERLEREYDLELITTAPTVSAL